VPTPIAAFTAMRNTARQPAHRGASAMAQLDLLAARLLWIQTRAGAYRDLHPSARLSRIDARTAGSFVGSWQA
jgi:hypothetical protein